MPTTIGVLDKDGSAQTVNTLPALGSAADAASLPVSQSTEDKVVSAAIKSSVEKIKTAGQATMANSHPVVIASDQSAVAVKTSAIVVSQEVTRYTDTTAYAINDVVNNSPSAPAVGVLADFFSANGASGYLSKFELWTDQAANVAAYRIHLFNAAPTAINDNSAFTLLYADISKHLGYIDISNMSQEGSGSTGALGLWTGQLLLKAAAADNDLYYVITAKSAFTPASGQKFTARGSLDSN
jgi:hypothetical protein